MSIAQTLATTIFYVEIMTMGIGYQCVTVKKLIQFRTAPIWARRSVATKMERISVLSILSSGSIEVTPLEMHKFAR